MLLLEKAVVYHYYYIIMVIGCSIVRLSGITEAGQRKTDHWTQMRKKSDSLIVTDEKRYASEYKVNIKQKNKNE